MMKDWEKYQHRAADLLRELGFTVGVNEKLAEANGAVHAIDVTARRIVAGVSLLWVVECKLWNRRVPQEKVSALKGIVDGVGADRGLLMSEKGFQSGAIRTGSQKNITLTSLADLRANASDEILAARLALAEKAAMDLVLRVNRDLRPSAPQALRMLATLATRIPPEIVDGFAKRPEAVDFGEGIAEVWSQAEGVTPDDAMAFASYRDEWLPGLDKDVMDLLASAINGLTEAFYQGRLGQWPALPPTLLEEIRESKPMLGVGGKLAWSMAQLVDAAERVIPELGRRVSEQEAKADGPPRLPFFGSVNLGTMPPPPPYPWPHGIHE